jgi:hypothetical protein
LGLGEKATEETGAADQRREQEGPAKGQWSEKSDAILVRE